jgi:hypothetical protein
MEIMETMKRLPVMKNLSSLLLAVSLASTAFALPVDLGYRSRGTPYDQFMSPVYSVLRQTENSKPSLDQVRKLMHTGRAFRYSYTNPYVPSLPAITESRRAGDCKDKALWLASQLDDSSVRFVIGKARRASRMSHAWLYWQDSDARWWILDCTNRRDPVQADRVSSSQYIPFYSYAKGGTYRHEGIEMVSKSGRDRGVAVADNR